jgi:hypothetical protein
MNKLIMLPRLPARGKRGAAFPQQARRHGGGRRFLSEVKARRHFDCIWAQNDDQKTGAVL